MAVRFARLLGGIAALGALLSCTTDSAPHTNTDPASAAALMVLPGATGVARSREYDGMVTYQLDEPFPAGKVVAFINAQLQEQGWVQRTTDFLNPGSPMSHSSGWTEFSVDKERVFSWVGQWQNDRGDIVLYGLTYRVPETEFRASGPMSVQAVFFSSSTAEKLIQQQRPGA